MNLKTIGKYLFLLTLVLALLVAFIPKLGSLVWLSIIVVLLGVVAGILWIEKGDETGFLVLTIAIATIPTALLMGFGASKFVGYLSSFFGGILIAAFSASVGIILKNIYRWIVE